jgi:succinate dehydrogenase / fumarate reductase membrane anchor subunit
MVLENIMSGLSRWLWQRYSALYILLYSAYVFFFIITHQSILNFILWSNFMHRFHVKVGTLLALVFLCIHSWIGCWTIATDYIKCYKLRVFLLGIYGFMLLASLASGVLLLEMNLL